TSTAASLLASSATPATPELYTLSLHDALPISCDAEVRQHGVAIGEQDILGLHVAMHKTVTVGEVEAGADFLRDAQCILQRQLMRSEEHTSELQSRSDLVCRLLLEKKKKKHQRI